MPQPRLLWQLTRCLELVLQQHGYVPDIRLPQETCTQLEEQELTTSKELSGHHAFEPYFTNTDDTKGNKMP
eukprot:1873916-Amphidinium_carterae.1